MISFFRRALSSWLVLGLLGLVLIAFIITGIGTPNAFGGGSATGDTVATVGERRLTSAETIQRAQVAVQGMQQQQPEMTMANFVGQGGIDSLVRQLIEARAIEQWANEHGIVASKRLVDGEIASIPAFRGLSGKFDETTYRNLLAQQRITEAQFRNDIT
ncbi:MAG: SurA N-terminal domain-containing protein, partial [Sphingomonadaceae bacterium]